jgi:hypothetical protein
LALGILGRLGRGVGLSPILSVLVIGDLAMAVGAFLVGIAISGPVRP